MAACGGGSSSPDYRNVATLEAAVKANTTRLISGEGAGTIVTASTVRCTADDPTRLSYTCFVTFHNGPSDVAYRETVAPDGRSYHTQEAGSSE